MTAVLLHLSDIHIKAASDPILTRAQQIASCTFNALPLAKHVFIVISGDIAYSGQAYEYALAKDFFEEIKQHIQKETECPISFVLAPGNHDCNFNADNGARRAIIKHLLDSDSTEVDQAIIDTCTGVQLDFLNFRDEIETSAETMDDRLWRSKIFQVEGVSINFNCLNISWVSQLNETQGALYFPIGRYSSRKSDTADINIFVMHHPLNWFGQNIYRQFRMFVRQLANIVISGHEHRGNVGFNEDVESGKSVYVEGCVLQGDKDGSESSFNIILLNLEKKEFLSNCFKWARHKNQFILSGEGSWSNYQQLPDKQKNKFEIQSEFLGILDDAGAFFRHPGRSDIFLSDVFVYPDMRVIGNNDQKKLVSSSTLLDPKTTENGVIIEGDEKSGCTSLLRQLYRGYHGRGFVPVFINGEDIKKITDNDIDGLIRKSVEYQYGEEKIISFEQESKERKILLINDFDRSHIKSSLDQLNLLCAFKKRFGHLVVTVGEMFEMQEIIRGAVTAGELTKLERYHIQSFGYVLRSKLIKKWFSLGLDGTIDDATLLARCDKAERLINVVMTRSVIPSVPFYLLTLLQSIEAGQSSDFKESALGYYYQYHLTEGFQRSGVSSDKLTEVFQYCSHLAWYFHARNSKELLEHELREFNAQFSKIWHTVDFKERIQVLLNARVLRRISGDSYSFRYPYIYYYLKGMYLSENLLDIEIRAYIGHCCEHLYVREHANTVLFLAHHTNDNFVIDSISSALHGLFRTHAPVTFEGDTDGVAKLIQDAPKLTYSGESPEEHRERRDVIQDDLDDGGDGLLDTEENSSELSLIAQLTMLFKTIEILGQVLKNQYSKIQRTQKNSLLLELFNGPLRAIRGFFDFCEKNPDSLVREIDAELLRLGKLEDKDKRKSVARRVVSEIIQLIPFCFVLKAAEGASSESLAEDIASVVRNNNTLALKIIDLAISLDSPKLIPRKKLKQLYKDANNDLLATRLIQRLTLHRLYMFKTSEQDMQWLSSELAIDLPQQHLITYQAERAKRIK